MKGLLELPLEGRFASGGDSKLFIERGRINAMDDLPANPAAASSQSVAPQGSAVAADPALAKAAAAASAAPTLPAPPAPPQPQVAKKPEHKSFQNSKAFVIIPLLLIIVVLIGGYFLITTKPVPTTTTTASSTIAAVPNRTTTVASTTITNVSASNSSSGCPCLKEGQVQTLLNDSKAYASNALFNVSLETGLASIKSAHPNLATVFNSLPANTTSGITRGWFLSYNSTANATTKEAFQQQVLESSSNTADFCSSYASSLSAAGQLSDVHLINIANGFAYSYINGTIGPYYSLSLVGCKANYIVIVSLLKPTNSIVPTAAIADQISALV